METDMRVRNLTGALSIIIPVVALGASILSLAQGSSASSPEKAFAISVSESQYPDKDIYSYEITNHSTQSIVSISIGFDLLHDRFELSSVPLGWTFSSGVPSSSVTSPANWNMIFSTEEESPFTSLEWSTANPKNGILPGKTMGGFSIVLPQEDDLYRTAHWTAIVDGGYSLTLPMQPPVNPNPNDSIPPDLSVIATPSMIWPPNDKMVPINVTINVHDNLDPNPVVRLVSITSNEPIDPTRDIESASIGSDSRNFRLKAARNTDYPEGRRYIITYSATDASGNIAIAQAFVQVPRHNPQEDHPDLEHEDSGHHENESNIRK
jgi:hypothetical protein